MYIHLVQATNKIITREFFYLCLWFNWKCLSLSQKIALACKTIFNLIFCEVCIIGMYLYLPYFWVKRRQINREIRYFCTPVVDCCQKQKWYLAHCLKFYLLPLWVKQRSSDGGVNNKWIDLCVVQKACSHAGTNTRCKRIWRRRVAAACGRRR